MAEAHLEATVGKANYSTILTYLQQNGYDILSLKAQSIKFL